MTSESISLCPPGWQALEACPICHALNIRHLDTVRHGLKIWKCGCCRVIFLNPRPMNTSYKPGYVHLHYLPRLIKGGLLGDDHTPDLRAIYGRYRKAADLTAEVFDPAHGQPVLDIGSGIGLSMLALKHVGIPSVGIDRDDEFVDFARDRFGLDVIQCDVGEFEPAERYQVALSNAVLEHLPDPVAALARIRRCVLAPAGHLVITVPNIASVQYVTEGRDWDLFGGGHLWYPSESTFAVVAERAGFEVVRFYQDQHPLGDGLARLVEDYVHNILEVEVNVRGGIGVILRSPTQDRSS